jgi:hypothetical protein
VPQAAHHAAAKPTVATQATGAGATVITHKKVEDTAPTRNSLPRSGNPDVAFAMFAVIRAPAVIMRSMSSA